jgi:hypothetical protein
MMSGHCAARSHLSRFKIVDEAMCVCLKDYETVYHLIWHCERFETERRRLTDALNLQPGTPVRGYVCSEEVAGDEVLSGFPRKSWNENLMTWLFLRLARQMIARTIDDLSQRDIFFFKDT